MPRTVLVLVVSLFVLALAVLSPRRPRRQRYALGLGATEDKTQTKWQSYFESCNGFGDDSFSSARTDFNAEVETLYGELLPSSLRALLSEKMIKIDEHDVMYDLGSGVGKVAAQFALETACGRCTGIELGERRHREAQAALASLLASGDPQLVRGAKKMALVHADLLDVPWQEDATILFINAFCYPPPLMRAIEARVKGISDDGSSTANRTPRPNRLKYIFLCGQRFRLDMTMALGDHYESYFASSSSSHPDGDAAAAGGVGGGIAATSSSPPAWPYNLYELPAPMSFSDQTEVQLYVSHEAMMRAYE